MNDFKNGSCIVYEVLNPVKDGIRPISEMQISENNGLMTLEGCFGVCAKKNRNNRIYEKDNYTKMVESMQDRIAREGSVGGELEHPQGLNINLENISHKITKIGIDENGVVTGTIQLLNTPKGKIAQALVEGGCPLYISSRATGNVDKEGKVKLENLVTYDLVGTPGFEEAKMNLKENQQFECLTESLCVVTEKECDENGECCKSKKKIEDDIDENGDCCKDKKKKKVGESAEEDDEENVDENGECCKDKKKKKVGESAEENLDEDEKEEKKKDKKKEKTEKEEESLQELKDLIESLNTKISDMQAHIELLENSSSKIDENLKNWITDKYTPVIEKWLDEHISDMKNEDGSFKGSEDIKTEIKEWVANQYSDGVQEWMINEFAPEVQKWIVEHYSPEVERWLNKEFKESLEGDKKEWFCENIAPFIQKWIIEEYSPEVQKWMIEHYSTEVQNWVINEVAPGIQNWVTEQFAPAFKDDIREDCQKMIDESLQVDKATKLKSIQETLELLEGLTPSKPEYSKSMITEGLKQNEQPLYIQKMPLQFKPLFESASDGVKEYISRKAQLYSFSGDESIVRFWESVDFTKDLNVENVYEGLNNITDERERSIRAQFRSHRNRF